MSDAQDHTGTPPAGGGNPTPNSVAAAIAGSQQPQQQNNLPQATTQSVSSLPATTAAQPSVGSDEVQNCMWKGCNQHFPSAAALYEHLCEQHIGRKSTNNLNLICQWGTCTTSTVKRDHITSHMRVHVPLKPHKCDFCGKSFKRPQDLKKHVKTHADDSVLMRSPDPPRGGAPGGAGYRPAPGTLGDQLQNMASAAQGFYGGPDLGSNGGYGAAPNAQSSAGYYSAPQGSSYGPVYYNAAAPESYESKKRLLIEALSEFFGEVKNKPMNASSYNDISTRLSGLAGVEIPVAGGGGYGGGFGGNTFGGGPAVASNLGHGHARDYALPLPTVKNRNDLSNIDHFLDQLQTSMMENENQAAAAGVAQAGTHYVHPGVHRSSHSPTEGHHAAHPASTHMSAFNPMTTTADSGTPALTPASSVTSYAAGQSPGSVHSHHSAAMSHGHRGSQGNMSMYPNLPSIPAMADPSTSAGPTANLGATYDDGRRRFNGNMLQKAAPTAEDAMDVSPVTSRRNSHEDLHKDVKSMSLRSPSVIDPAIDPALGGDDSDEEKKDDEEKHRGQWLSKVRTIETMREIVRIMIDEEIYPGGRNFEKYPNYFDEDHDHEDEATTPTAAGPSKYPWSSNDDENESSAMDEKKDEDPLYPRLRAALDSDNV